MPGNASKWVLDDLWERVRPLRPKPRRRTWYPGRKPMEDRKVLTGMIFVLRIGIPGREMPTELGCGAGMTCLRRLKQWHRKGVFQKLYEMLLAELNGRTRSTGRARWSTARRQRHPAAGRNRAESQGSPQVRLEGSRPC